MFVIVAYDITDDKRRLRVFQELKNFGARVLRSVFECHLTEDQLVTLKERLALEIDCFEDNVRYYVLCKDDTASMEVVGKNVIYRDEDYFVV